MDVWIKEVIGRLKRSEATVLFGGHAAKDKNLTTEDVDNVVRTVRIGKVDDTKSTQEKERVCFKNYFDKEGITYFVVTEYHPDFIKIITVIKKKGKH